MFLSLLFFKTSLGLLGVGVVSGDQEDDNSVLPPKSGHVSAVFGSVLPQCFKSQHSTKGSLPKTLSQKVPDNKRNKNRFGRY